MNNRFGYLTLYFVIVMLFGANNMMAQSPRQYHYQAESIADIWYMGVEKGIDLFVKEIGTGDTIVVVHGGFGAEHSYLLDLVAGMEQDFHFVFYDQRGSLRSPAPDTMITAMSHVEDLELLRKELRIKQLNLLGHSMGTWIASAYLDKYPQHVKQMTLLGLVWPRPDLTEEEAEISAAADDAFQLFLERDAVGEVLHKEGLDREGLSEKESTYKWRIKFASASIYDLSNWRKMKGGWAFYKQEAGTAAGSTMPQSYDWIKTYEDNPQVAIEVINGTHDFVDFGGQLQKRWLTPLSNVSYHLVENAGHNAWIDQAAEIQALLSQALRAN